MGHCVIPGGLFATACKALLSNGFKLAWGEIADAVGGENEGD
jgi:hypothetical protein